MTDETKAPIKLATRSQDCRHSTPQDAIELFQRVMAAELEDGFEVDRVVICYVAKNLNEDRKEVPSRTSYLIAGPIDVHGALGALERAKHKINKDHDA